MLFIKQVHDWTCFVSSVSRKLFVLCLARKHKFAETTTGAKLYLEREREFVSGNYTLRAHLERNIGVFIVVLPFLVMSWCTCPVFGIMFLSHLWFRSSFSWKATLYRMYVYVFASLSVPLAYVCLIVCGVCFHVPCVLQSVFLCVPPSLPFLVYPCLFCSFLTLLLDTYLVL